MKNTKFRVIMYIDLVFLILATIANVYGYSETKDYQFILNTLAVIYSIIYLLYGYKKEGAIYFLCFMLFLAIKELLVILNMIIVEKVPMYVVIITAAMMLGYIVLGLGKNLGKKRSFIICGIILVISLIELIIGLSYKPIVITEGTIQGVALAIYNITRLLMAIILGIMVYAKYEDKYSRGTK